MTNHDRSIEEKEGHVAKEKRDRVDKVIAFLEFLDSLDKLTEAKKR